MTPARGLHRFDRDVKSVGFEAGTLTQYLTYGLQAAGFEVVCLEARQVSVTLAAMRNKTDRNDARGIAQILRTGWYSRVHVKSLHSHQVRALLARRRLEMTDGKYRLLDAKPVEALGRAMSNTLLAVLMPSLFP